MQYYLRKASTLILFILFLTLICLIPSTSDLPSEGVVDSSITDGKKQLKKASELIDRGLYREAEGILFDLGNDASWQKEVVFLLGRLYKEEGSLEKAEGYLIKAIDSYPLLRDYALRLLSDVYMSRGDFEKVIETVRMIRSPFLQKESKQLEIRALLVRNEDEAIKALSQYTRDYPMDWSSKFTLAALFKKQGINDKAIHLFKEIYINVSPLSEDAVRMLKDLKEGVFTKEELLKRADNLFESGDYQGAEAAYKEVLKSIDANLKDKVMFSIGMCQFRLKQYVEAARTFSLVRDKTALYWQARAFFRLDDREGFDRVIKEFEKDYPSTNILFVRLLLMSGDDYRRKGDLSSAEKIYKRVLENFPEKKEDALWGLGWMYYSSGDYKRALTYLSKLTAYHNSRDYYKYLYWQARAHEKLAEGCMRMEASLSAGQADLRKDYDEDLCANRNDFFSTLSSDDGYYGYLIRFRSADNKTTGRLEISRPVRPDGEIYERIEALVLLGMRDWVREELIASLRMTKESNEFFYLSQIAMELNEYKSIITFVEKNKGNKEFLPLSYPLGYGDIVKNISKEKGIDAYLVTAVIREESRFDPTAFSQAGAIGLMQLMPSTARRFKNELNIEHIDRTELQSVRKNILLGTHYLSVLLREFKAVPYALAAYNAGENAMRKWLNNNNKDLDEFIEDIPYTETRGYVMKVLESYWQYRAINGLPIEGF